MIIKAMNLEKETEFEKKPVEIQVGCPICRGIAHMWDYTLSKSNLLEF